MFDYLWSINIYALCITHETTTTTACVNKNLYIWILKRPRTGYLYFYHTKKPDAACDIHSVIWSALKLCCSIEKLVILVHEDRSWQNITHTTKSKAQIGLVVTTMIKWLLEWSEMYVTPKIPKEMGLNKFKVTVNPVPVDGLIVFGAGRSADTVMTKAPYYVQDQHRKGESDLVGLYSGHRENTHSKNKFSAVYYHIYLVYKRMLNTFTNKLMNIHKWYKNTI